jgi:porin
MSGGSRSARRAVARSTATLLLWVLPAIAQIGPAGQPLPSAPATSAAGQAGSGSPEPAPSAGLRERQDLLDDPGGLRTLVGNYGISLGLTETSEVLGNVTGGVRRGFEYTGVTSVTLDLDTEKAFAWAGGSFHASALQIHGRDLSTDNLVVLQTISTIDASRSTRLWELWYQQTLSGDDADFKFGQQSLDQEFFINDDSGVFLNGWPALLDEDLYAGGPIYPLSSLGVRLRAKPSSALTVLAGVFDDNPPGGPFYDDSELRDGEASGTRFNLGTGALFIGEIQIAVARPPLATGPRADLPGIYKLGAWFDTGRFPDQRFDTADLSLASPGSTGLARRHRGNFSIYGLIDQGVWHAQNGPRSLAVFARVMGAPDDRNLVDWILNAGINVKAPLSGRENDVFALGYNWAHVSGRASDLDRNIAVFTGTAFPIRSAEHCIELTYQYQVAPWWQLQPDVQYVVNPGGGIPNPLDPLRRLGNELVLGVRAIFTF